ncbi:MAG: PAS domain-containing protein, partial [Steroidobacteraceae bacterium]|nr:PAS domain-containing protein [Steroidobacteraceae bacterium]
MPPNTASWRDCRRPGTVRHRQRECGRRRLRRGTTRQFRMRHEDGHWVWLRARAALAPGDNPEAPHLIGIVFDITAQK